LQREHTGADLPQPGPTRTHAVHPEHTTTASHPAEPTRTQLPPATTIRANLTPPEPTRAYASPPEPVRAHVPTNLATTSDATLTNHVHTPLTNGTVSLPARIDLSSLLQTTQNTNQPIHASNASTSTIQSLFNAAPQIPGVPTMLNQDGQMRLIFLPFIDLDRLNINSNNTNQQ
jgi:hypothetical protein